MVELGTKDAEVVVKLADIKEKEVFRFAHASLADAMLNDEVFMRIKANSGEKRILAVALGGSDSRLFDPEHRVIRHDFKIIVYPN